MTDVASSADREEGVLQDTAAGSSAYPASAQPPAPAQAPTQALAQALTLRAMQGVELEVDVVIGRSRMTLARLLGIRPRSTFSLNRALHSPAEVMVNGTLFARGELVALNDAELGVQITEIVNADLPQGNA